MVGGSVDKRPEGNRPSAKYRTQSSEVLTLRAHTSHRLRATREIGWLERNKKALAIYNRKTGAAAIDVYRILFATVFRGQHDSLFRELDERCAQFFFSLAC